MEALFFEKKLITNNQDICNYDFFNSGNIFILGQRTLDELTDFLAAPYITVPSAIKEKYLFENWIKRFL